MGDLMGKLVTLSLDGELQAAAAEIDISDFGTLSYYRHKVVECEQRTAVRARLLLFSSDEGEALWIAADECTFRRGAVQEVKEWLERHQAIPANAILLAADHVHSAHNYPSFQGERFARAVGAALSGMRKALQPIGAITTQVGMVGEGEIVNRRLPLGGLGDLCVMFNDDCSVDMRAKRLDASGAAKGFLASLGTTAAAEGLAETAHFLSTLSDRRLHLWRILDRSGAPIATVFRVNAHAVTVSQSKVGAILSADYIHFLTERVKEANGGVACLVFNGAFGDTRPLQAEYSFAEAERIGRRWAEAALAAPGVESSSAIGLVAVAAPAVKLPLRRDVPHSTKEVQELVGRLEATTPKGAAERKRHAERLTTLRAMLLAEPPENSGILRAGELDSGSLSCEWQFWQVGPIRLLAMPGEPFVELCREFEAASGGALTIGIANGYISYVPTAEGVARGGYEGSMSMLDGETIRGLPALAATLLPSQL